MFTWRSVIFHPLEQSSHLHQSLLPRICRFMFWVNNAGLLENDRVTTSEGYEMNFAVNALGTFAMTELMVPLMEKAVPDARVITVSSGGMYTEPLTEDLQFSDSKFDGSAQYARNKRVQEALTEKWAALYKDKGIGFYSLHPGWADTPGVTKSLPGFSKVWYTSGANTSLPLFSGLNIWFYPRHVIHLLG